MVQRMTTEQAQELTPQELSDRDNAWSLYRDDHINVYRASSGPCWGHTLYSLVTFDELKRPATEDCCTSCNPEQAEAFRKVTDLRTHSIT